jgi:hypothetical protein
MQQLSSTADPEQVQSRYKDLTLKSSQEGVRVTPSKYDALMQQLSPPSDDELPADPSAIPGGEEEDADPEQVQSRYKDLTLKSSREEVRATTSKEEDDDPEQVQSRYKDLTLKSPREEVRDTSSKFGALMQQLSPPSDDELPADLSPIPGEKDDDLEQLQGGLEGLTLDPTSGGGAPPASGFSPSSPTDKPPADAPSTLEPFAKGSLDERLVYADDVRQLLEASKASEQRGKSCRSKDTAPSPDTADVCLRDFARSSEQGRMTLCRIAFSIAASLAQLHKKNLVHMNIRPKFVRIIRDDTTAPVSAQLLFSPGCVPVGQRIQKTAPGYLDFSTDVSVQKRIAKTADDLWALGLTILELFYGPDANPCRLLRHDARTGEINRREWKRAVGTLALRPIIDQEIDSIISGLLQAPSRRMTAEAVVREFSKILNLETAEVLVEPPHDEQERQERIAVAYGVAKDYLERAPHVYLKISPQNIELIRDERTHGIVGARLISEVARVQPATVDELKSDPQRRCFGLLLWNLFYGNTAISSKIDFDNIPDEKSAEWEKIIEELKGHKDLARSHEVIDQVIWLLLTDKDFGVAFSIGLLQGLFTKNLKERGYGADISPTIQAI